MKVKRNAGRVVVVGILVSMVSISMFGQTRTKRSSPRNDRTTIQTPAGPVQVKNFFKTIKPKTFSNETWYTLYDSGPGSIEYYVRTNRFVITSQPLSRREWDQNRAALEKQFLKILGITQEDACKLRVDMSAVNKYESWSGKYPLSFCSK